MILCFDKPKKIHNTEEHNKMYSSDSCVDGTYVPNMSIADRNKWKGKHIKGDDERIEIRKTFDGIQLLIVVYKKPNPVTYSYENKDIWNKKHQNIKISMNGKLDLSINDYAEMNIVINESIQLLK